MLSDVIEYLICPKCGSGLTMGDGVVSCGHGHSYDVARQGYVNLMPGTPKGSALGDTAAMVDARAEFLRRGHFSSLARSVSDEAARTAHDMPDGCVVDVGAGTGYYLTEILDSLPERFGLALDASKYSARRAARCHERAGAVVCDAWQMLPVRSGAATLVVNVFAPRNAVEVHRILGPEGHLVVVTPTTDHLGSLVNALDLVTVDELKEERLEEKLGGRFRLVRRTPIEFLMSLGHPDVEALVAMGPSAWHTDRGEIRSRIAALPDPVEGTASVALSVYEPH